MGDKASVRFTAVDQLSRVGDPSVVTEIVVKGIVGDDIEVNSINANVIEAGTITVSLLEAGIGGKLDISANNMVQIIVGQQDQLSNDIAAANETIADNALGVTQAMNDAAGAQSSADEAKESATFAQRSRTPPRLTSKNSARCTNSPTPPRASRLPVASRLSSCPRIASPSRRTA